MGVPLKGPPPLLTGGNGVVALADALAAESPAALQARTRYLYFVFGLHVSSLAWLMFAPAVFKSEYVTPPSVERSILKDVSLVALSTQFRETLVGLIALA